MLGSASSQSAACPLVCQDPDSASPPGHAPVAPRIPEPASPAPAHLWHHHGRQRPEEREGSSELGNTPGRAGALGQGREGQACAQGPEGEGQTRARAGRRAGRARRRPDALLRAAHGDGRHFRQRVFELAPQASHLERAHCVLVWAFLLPEPSRSTEAPQRQRTSVQVAPEARGCWARGAAVAAGPPAARPGSPRAGSGPHTPVSAADPASRPSPAGLQAAGGAEAAPARRPRPAPPALPQEARLRRPSRPPQGASSGRRRPARPPPRGPAAGSAAAPP